ncbi:MAG: LL-diaminopimelate aminotransferase [Treponema sp.]|jgi:LL-diaminopimelate aminotransferase|nr:LL-diaminopimelate aminotransferase [Treponema sp.]
MISRNPCIANLQAGYLFPEIAKRRRAFVTAHPESRIISLGVGDTTEPLFPHICESLVKKARALGTADGYSGYSDEGLVALRERLNEVYYHGAFASDEIFISDGAKCDIGRLQLLFGSTVPIVVQDPAYPVYVDGSVLIGAAGTWNGYGYTGIKYVPCTAENGYFPDLTQIPKQSLIYFCSPNNPTGTVATTLQLTTLVEHALKANSIIIFDAAYSEYIRDSALVKSIFAIEGAEKCAIEVNSFSKPAGFTGVRLGWTVVPHTLKYESGEEINTDWARVMGTVFNGASNIAQAGGLAALDAEGLVEMQRMCDFYLGNAALIRQALDYIGINSVGGIHAPYLWAHFPGRDSWEVFDEFLESCHIVTTPGVGFGPSGQSFIRFSAFGHRDNIEEACIRLCKLKR